MCPVPHYQRSFASVAFKIGGFVASHITSFAFYHLVRQDTNRSTSVIFSMDQHHLVSGRYYTIGEQNFSVSCVAVASFQLYTVYDTDQV